MDLSFLEGIEFYEHIPALAAKALAEIPDLGLLIELAIIGALRGNTPEDGEEIILCNGQTFMAFMEEWATKGVVHYGGETLLGPLKRLTPIGLSYAFAEVVALELQVAHDDNHLHKRFHHNRLPSYLEFMGAGSLRLPWRLRQEHLAFARELSSHLESVGGRFSQRQYDWIRYKSPPLRNLKLGGLSDNQ